MPIPLSFFLFGLFFCYPCYPCNPWLNASSAVHLEAAGRLEGLTVVDEERFTPVGGPAYHQDIEAGGAVEQTVLLQEVERQPGQALLLDVVHRGGGALEVFGAGGAHLHEDDGAALHGDNVDLAVRAAVVTPHDREALTLQIAHGGALGARAEPAPPPGLACGRGRHSFWPACSAVSFLPVLAALVAPFSPALGRRSRRRVALPTRSRK